MMNRAIFNQTTTSLIDVRQDADGNVMIDSPLLPDGNIIEINMQPNPTWPEANEQSDMVAAGVLRMMDKISEHLSGMPVER